jgi:hypothetical protein
MHVWVENDGLKASWLCLVRRLSCLTLVSSGSVPIVRWWCVSIWLLLLVILVPFRDSVVALARTYSPQTGLFPALP